MAKFDGDPRSDPGSVITLGGVELSRTEGPRPEVVGAVQMVFQASRSALTVVTAFAASSRAVTLLGRRRTNRQRTKDLLKEAEGIIFNRKPVAIGG